MKKSKCAYVNCKNKGEYINKFTGNIYCVEHYLTLLKKFGTKLSLWRKIK